MLDKIDIQQINNIAIEAGKAVMEIYNKDFSVEYKNDKSPLTQADTVANQIICTELENLSSKLKIEDSMFKSIPIMSEENKQIPYKIRENWQYYWCVDPIDGTKEFINKNGEFTVNIALIHKNTPVLGVVYAPALGELYYAKQGEGAFKEVLNASLEVLVKRQLPLKQNKDLKKSISVVASKSHMSEETQKFVDNLALGTQHLTLVSKGSSLKLCMVATGEADIYPRLAPTMEWDTAAADAIVREVGKMSYDYTSIMLVPMMYNKKRLTNNWFIVS
jgi:3'(2'), 5'-bisphosphate nucleotidase